ncbi:MAG: hypothetical protein MJA83_03195, partial [Gammaproteobacteria bacterium]|nr:hypothetical protein [Gammaproteobacteria bacterium]
DGDRVAAGEPLDVIIQSFDRFGIETVEARRTGTDWVVLDNPNVFRTPLPLNDFNPVTIEARATDPNGNTSDVASVTVQPFDPEAGEPRLGLFAPENGSTFNSSEDVTLEVLMRNIPDAELFYDIGGVESASPAATIVRPIDGADRFLATVTLPDESVILEDTVVVVRLVSGGLRARLFLNVKRDAGIDQAPEVSIFPASNILGGSDLWIDSAVPEDMDDFSTDSDITVEDPSGGAAVATLAMAEGPRKVDISTEGAAVAVNANLRDRSRHEVVARTDLNKLAYFGPDVATLFTPASADTRIRHVTVVPGLKPAGDSIIWVAERLGGGYELRDSDGVIASENTGRIDSLHFTGTGVLAQEGGRGDNRVIFWPLENGGLGAPAGTTLFGEVLGGNGDTIYIRSGATLGGLRYAGGEFLPVAGAVLTDSFRAAHVDGARLLVLSESGLYGFELGDADQLELQQRFFTAVPDNTDFLADGDRLITWSGESVTRYQLADDGTLTEIGVLNTQGPVTAAFADGDLVWLLADGPFADNTWQAWRDNEL